MSKIYNEINTDFTQIPNTILQDSNVSGLAFKIYCYICFRIGRNKEWEFFNDEILNHCKEGRDAFRKARNQLIELGYLKKVKQNTKDDGTFGGCDYIIYKEPSTDFQSSDNPSTDFQSSINKEINNKDLKKKEKEKNIKKENDFDSLWSLYGKIGNRKQSEKSFLKVIKTVSIEILTKAITDYLKHLESIKKDDFYPIKHMSTWLNNEGWKDIYETKEIKTEEQKTESKIETQDRIKEIKQKVNTLEDFSDELLNDSNEIKRRRNDLFRDEQDKIFKSIKKDIYSDNEEYLENLSIDQKEIGIEKPQVDFENLSFTNRQKEDLENELKTRSGELAKCLDEKIGVEVATELIDKMVKKIVDYERESKHNTSFLELGKIKKSELVAYISEQSILFIDCLGYVDNYTSYLKSSRFPDIEDLKRNVEKIKAEKSIKIKDIKLFIEYAQNENFIDELIKDYKEKYRYIFKSIKSLHGKRELA